MILKSAWSASIASQKALRGIARKENTSKTRINNAIRKTKDFSKTHKFIEGGKIMKKFNIKKEKNLLKNWHFIYANSTAAKVLHSFVNDPANECITLSDGINVIGAVYNSANFEDGAIIKTTTIKKIEKKYIKNYNFKLFYAYTENSTYALFEGFHRFGGKL